VVLEKRQPAPFSLPFSKRWIVTMADHPQGEK